MFRGSLEDVLDRYVEAAGDHSGAIMRITGDCPLLDPALADEVWDLQSTRMRHGHTDDAKPGLWGQTAPKVGDVDGHKCRATRHP